MQGGQEEAFREDLARYEWAVEHDQTFEAMDALIFMESQGFLTQLEIEWWAGKRQLEKYEKIEKDLDPDDL